ERVAAFELQDIRYNVASPLHAYVNLLDAVIAYRPEARALVERLPKPADHQPYAVLPKAGLKVLADVKYASFLSRIVQSIADVDIKLYASPIEGWPTAPDASLAKPSTATPPVEAAE